MNPDTETLGLDSAQSGVISRLGLIRGLAVLFIGSLPLSDTERLQRVDQYKLVSVTFKDYSSQLRIKLKINLNQYQSSRVYSSQKG